jgi:hypoxanthine phosphoribosyltransferase
LNIVFSEEQIRNRVQELGVQISRDYGTQGVHVFGILDDGFIFFADLVRSLTCPVVCDFIKMDAQDTELGAQPLREIVYGPITAIEGKNILLVDALVGSGITLDYLVQQCWLQKPKSVRAAVMIDREAYRRLPYSVDYAGFGWDGNLLVGYGLSLGSDGFHRNLPHLAAIARGNETETVSKGGAVTQ